MNSYRVLTVPAHTVTKIAALLDRPDSLPGRKDRYEILRLLDDKASAETPEIIAAASTRTSFQLRTLLHDAFEILAAEPELAKRARAKLRESPG